MTIGSLADDFFNLIVGKVFGGEDLVDIGGNFALFFIWLENLFLFVVFKVFLDRSRRILFIPSLKVVAPANNMPVSGSPSIIILANPSSISSSLSSKHSGSDMTGISWIHNLGSPSALMPIIPLVIWKKPKVLESLLKPLRMDKAV